MEEEAGLQIAHLPLSSWEPDGISQMVGAELSIRSLPELKPQSPGGATGLPNKSNLTFSQWKLPALYSLGAGCWHLPTPNTELLNLKLLLAASSPSTRTPLPVGGCLQVPIPSVCKSSVHRDYCSEAEACGLVSFDFGADPLEKGILQGAREVDHLLC